MNNLFKILNELSKKKIAYCLADHGDMDYYNLSITNPLGEKEYFSGDNLELIEKTVEIMWGHLIGVKSHVKITVEAKGNSTLVGNFPAPPSMPLPPGVK